MNILYFLLYFVCISIFSLLRFISLDISPWYYSYSLAQSLFEVGLFAWIAQFLKYRTPAWVYSVYLTLLFTCLLIHYTHFTILRLMDSSLSFLFNFFAGRGIAHLITVFQAINMNRSILLLIGAAILFLPLIGIGLYRITARMSYLPKISSFQIVSMLVPVGLFLSCFDWFALAKMSHVLHAKYQKTLPLGTTLFPPKIPFFSMQEALSPPRDQNEILEIFEQCTIASKPNIYLFVIETLRKDFITQQIAPHLHAFGKENVQFPISCANANATQHSWFAIFHSLLPYHWTSFPKMWKQGSVPLLILKNLGYKIHVYSSADLRYFDMDQMIFGPDRILADHMEEYADLGIESWEKDALVMQAFEKTVNTEEGREGNVFLLFLDATHSEYSFPADHCPFMPIVQKIDYLTINPKSIEPIINRYRNSVHYIDSLIHRFITKLKTENLYDQALIAITGDHGEEFFEDGSLFHGTHLNEAQTSVPILFKFQNNDTPIITNTATHIDIFPSLLDYLTKIPDDLFEGRSVFRKDRFPTRIAVSQNGAKTPSEFTVQKGNYQLHARFVDPENLYSQREIEILSERSARANPGQITD